jgi:hypothetical protein
MLGISIHFQKLTGNTPSAKSLWLKAENLSSAASYDIYIYIIILYYIYGNSTISFDEIYGQDQSLFIVMSVENANRTGILGCS